MAEILDIVDEQGRPTGQTVPRAVAHAEGIRHRTSHVWILRRHAGRVEVLLQMRCQAKDSFPGCYDISSAGHIPAGCDFVESALRELREELGVTLPADALQECGVRHFTFEDVFHGRLFKDNQVSKVFCLWLDKNAEDFTVQKEEIDYVRWFGLEEAIEAVKNNTIPNCIYLEELEMVAAAIRQRLLSRGAFYTKHPRTSNRAGVFYLLTKQLRLHYSFGPAATRALPCSLPSYLAKFLMKRLARSTALVSHSAASL